ncbi:MAG: sortase [Candidatus Moranbacteria bacterium]|nr:sortase [Candidatus Moranbacteria bacterium]
MKQANKQPGVDAGTWLLRAGTALLLLGVVLFLVVYFPILREEVGYGLRNTSAALPTVSISAADEGGNNVLVPVDPDFSIVIPKIGANVPVVQDVDASDPSVYRAALAQGIAHAKGTRLPGESGNVFLFAHSSDDFLTRGRYNTVFYLLDKLSVGDRFTIAYKGTLYDYRVFDKKTLSPEQVEYLNAKSEENTVTLMTCWPPGTDAKRLLVFGVLDGTR